LELSATWCGVLATRRVVLARCRKVLAKRRKVLANWRAFPAKWRAFPGKVWKVAATWKSFQGIGNIVSRAEKYRFQAAEIVSRRAASVSG